MVLLPLILNGNSFHLWSTSELSKKIQEFRNAHAEDEFAKANIEEFIFNSPDFEHVEIVFF